MMCDGMNPRVLYISFTTVRSCDNVIVGIIGKLFGHLLAFEIAMFRFVGVRNRVVEECQVVNSHCKMTNQLLECEFACAVFSYGSFSWLQQQRRHRNRSAQLIRYAQLFQQQHYPSEACPLGPIFWQNLRTDRNVFAGIIGHT